MKNNLTNILLVVLIISVGILFYMHFSSTKEIAAVKNNLTKTDSVAPQLSFSIPKNLAGARVLYVNIDTIDAKYEAFADLSKEAGNNYAYIQKQYQKKATELQQQYDTYQQNMANKLLSENDDLAAQARLNAGAEELKKLENQISALEGSAMEKNAIITNDISTYFKSYARDKKIDYILAYGGASNVLYANDSLDVTSDVLKSLNENYRLNKPSKKK